MRKFETIQIYIDYQQVDKTELYDLQIITLEGKQSYYSLTKAEVNTVLKAFEILEKKKWGNTNG